MRKFKKYEKEVESVGDYCIRVKVVVNKIIIIEEVEKMVVVKNFFGIFTPK